MFRKILVCSDLSPASDALVQCVGELRRVGTEEVVIAHAIPYPEAPIGEEARQMLERQARMVTEQGIRAMIDMPPGPAATALAESAERHEVSALFIGSHGKGILRAATLGSVSTDLLHRARRPVLLSRIELLEGGRCRTVCSSLFRRVLFPTDFSEGAEKALAYAALIGKETAAPVRLLHVLAEKGEDPAGARDAEERAQYLLEAKKRRLEWAGAVEVTAVLLKGDAEKEVVAVAGEGDFSLVVMGCNGKGALKEMFMGSVAHAAARHAAVPVLFIPGRS